MSFCSTLELLNAPHTKLLNAQDAAERDDVLPCERFLGNPSTPKVRSTNQSLRDQDHISPELPVPAPPSLVLKNSGVTSRASMSRLRSRTQKADAAKFVRPHSRQDQLDIASRSLLERVTRKLMQMLSAYSLIPGNCAISRYSKGHPCPSGIDVQTYIG